MLNDGGSRVFNRAPTKFDAHGLFSSLPTHFRTERTFLKILLYESRSQNRIILAGRPNLCDNIIHTCTMIGCVALVTFPVVSSRARLMACLKRNRPLFRTITKKKKFCPIGLHFSSSALLLIIVVSQPVMRLLLLNGTVIFKSNGLLRLLLSFFLSFLLLLPLVVGVVVV